jgi:hypothetical protein
MATYRLIQTYTATSAVSTITLSSIPATYTDLLLKVHFRVTRAVTASTFVMVFNGVTSGYSNRIIEANGGSVTSASSSGADIRDMIVPGNNATASIFGNTEIYISNYASTTKHKSISIDSASENNATTSYVELNAALWANTAAISSIVFSEPNGSSNFATNSTVYLYGISNA